MARTLKCPHCGSTEGKVTLEGHADVTYSCDVYAEVDLDIDLADDKVKVDGYSGHRYMPDFRLEEVLDRLEEIEHVGLMLDYSGDDPLMAFCFNCQGDVTDEFRAMLDGLHPREKVTT